jgi:hypothetical protein
MPDWRGVEGGGIGAGDDTGFNEDYRDVCEGGARLAAAINGDGEAKPAIDKSFCALFSKSAAYLNSSVNKVSLIGH